MDRRSLVSKMRLFIHVCRYTAGTILVMALVYLCIFVFNAMPLSGRAMNITEQIYFLSNGLFSITLPVSLAVILYSCGIMAEYTLYILHKMDPEDQTPSPEQDPYFVGIVSLPKEDGKL